MFGNNNLESWLLISHSHEPHFVIVYAKLTLNDNHVLYTEFFELPSYKRVQDHEALGLLYVAIYDCIAIRIEPA